ncbi:uncharacterized protein LOC116619980 isoform X2 [Nematostella vectensis]|nr:uncharacterized protein LOC116619980 isoform X2 [Nematostella vectensis]
MNHAVLVTLAMCAVAACMGSVQANDWIDDMVKARTQASLKKLEKDFMSVFKKYVINPAKAKGKVALEQQKRLKHDLSKVQRRSITLDPRIRRSGACSDVCRHRCIPECNLACCVNFPPGYDEKKVNSIEAKVAKKAETGTRKSTLSKNVLEKGSKCDSSCLRHCTPDCKFKCCIKLPSA